MNQSDSNLTNGMDNNQEQTTVPSNDFVESVTPQTSRTIFVTIYLFSDNSCFERLGFTVLTVNFNNLVPKDVYEQNSDAVFVLAFDNYYIETIKQNIECFKSLGIENYKVALPPHDRTWHHLSVSGQLASDKIEKTLNGAYLQGQLFFAESVQESVYFYHQQYPDSNTFIFPFKDSLYKATLDSAYENIDSSVEIKQLTDCSISFGYSVIDESKKDKCYHHLLLYSEREKYNHIKITDSDFTQTNLFIKALQQGRQTFYGKNKDLTELRSYLLASRPPKIKALASIGYDQDSQYYVFPEFCHALNGDKIYLNNEPYFVLQNGLSNYDGIMPFMNCTDTVIKPSQPAINTDLVNFIFALKNVYGEKALLMFGFYISGLFSHIVFKCYGFFPLLSLYGFPHPYGDDKSFLTRLFNRCLFIDSAGQKMKADFTAAGELKKIRQKSNLVCALLDNRDYKKAFDYDTVLPYYNRKLADLKAPLAFVSSNDTEPFSFEVMKNFLISLHFPNTVDNHSKSEWQQLNHYLPEQLACVGNYLLMNRQYFEQNLINTIMKYQADLTNNAIGLKMAQNYAIALSGIVCLFQLLSIPQENINNLAQYTLQRATHKQHSTQSPAYLAEYFLQLIRNPNLVKEGISLEKNFELEFSRIEHRPDLQIDLPTVLKQLKTQSYDFNQKMLEAELKKHPRYLGIDRSMESGTTRRVFVFGLDLKDKERFSQNNNLAN